MRADEATAPPASEPVGEPTSGQPPRGKGWAAAAAAASAGIAVLLSVTVFPHLSINNDEPINRLFADAIARGHLFPPTFGMPDAFRPWLAAVREGHFVLKYTPVVPAMMALSQLVTGGTTLYVAVIAGATTAMTYLLARELLQHRPQAVIAAALVALSPLFVVQSALLLSYVPTLLMLEVFVWGLVRGIRKDQRWLLTLSGLSFGLAFFARSYDALVFAAPFAAWALLGRFGRRLRLADFAALAVPASVTGAGFLAFNRAATGDMFKPPFYLLEPDDRLGFGVRRLYPTDIPHPFGIREGVAGVFRHGMELNTWVAGGTILLLLAGVTLFRRRVERPMWPLVAVAFLLPLSYVFFWGPWNATILWGGTRYVGPFYFLPVVLPVAFLGAQGLWDLYRWRTQAALGVAAAMLLVSGVVMWNVVEDNLSFTADQAALHDLVEGRPAGQLVFAGMPTPYLMHPTAVISNRSDLSGPVVYAIDQGPSNLEVAGRFPERTPYRLQFAGDFRRPGQPFSARLDELALRSGGTVEVGIQLAESLPRGELTLAVSALGVTREYRMGSDRPLPPSRLLVDEQGARLAGGQAIRELRQAGAAALDVEVLVAASNGSPASSVGRLQVPLGLTGRSLELLVPTGRSWTVGFPPPEPVGIVPGG